MTATSMRYLAALAAGIRDAMTDNPRVIMLGEDIGQNIRGTAPGLLRDFGPARVIDTPLSEQAFTGFATGAAMTGWRPVVEYQIPSLTYLAFEQIVNQANKAHLMTGGQVAVPVTYIVPGSGARRGLAGQHSDHPYALFAHAGVKVVVPSTPQQAYDSIRLAIDDDDPVVLFSPAAAQATRGPVDTSAPRSRTGCYTHVEGSDVTVVSVGHLAQLAVRVATDGSVPYSVEVLDPLWVYPLDRSGIHQSVARTGRLIVMDDGNLSCGFAAEVVATAACSGSLTRPPIRLTRPDMTAMPFAVTLELALQPSEDDLRAALSEVMSK